MLVKTCCNNYNFGSSFGPQQDYLSFYQLNLCRLQWKDEQQNSISSNRKQTKPFVDKDIDWHRLIIINPLKAVQFFSRLCFISLYSN